MQEKILMLVQSWSDAFRNTEHLQAFVRCHESLKAQGMAYFLDKYMIIGVSTVSVVCCYCCLWHHGLCFEFGVIHIGCAHLRKGRKGVSRNADISGQGRVYLAVCLHPFIFVLLYSSLRQFLGD